MIEIDFTHRFVPASSPASTRTLVLLHGTGGDENDLLPLGRDLDPAATLLSPKGKVRENGMPRFFRRLAEGVFDEEDVIKRAHELADFIEVAATRYEFDPKRVVAVGYSNGANIAAAILLLRPQIFSGAVLFRAMVPLIPSALPDLRDVAVFLSAGESDPIVPMENVAQLATMLQEAGASVTLRSQPAGHGLTVGDVRSAKEWLSGRERENLKT